MSDSKLPTEVELTFEVMPCNAMRSEAEPGKLPHACTYFHKWGTYHSYDYTEDGPPPPQAIFDNIKYVGRARLVPELLSGCRKAPIIAVGINPNLPGWWSFTRGSLNPLFDDYKQYAHYFRYRTLDKLALSKENYEQFGGGPQDTPASDFELTVPANAEGERVVTSQRQRQKMYEGYQGLLNDLAAKMDWQDHKLTVGEDLSYGNMVACPSARWTTVPLTSSDKPDDKNVPPMTVQERAGIVTECFHKRRYFLRQLFQSLPAVLLVFSQSTADAFIGEMQNNFSGGNPHHGEKLDDLMKREIRLHYGDLQDGTSLESRVIFSPHITGNPQDFGPARERVIEQLTEEAEAGRLKFNPATKHLTRARGACVFCTMLEIGPCGDGQVSYLEELQPITIQTSLTADAPITDLMLEKSAQSSLLETFLQQKQSTAGAWDGTDETLPSEPSRDS
jgi:hypothetical protein